MYDPHTKESRGFGFVMMKTHEDAMKAIAELDNKELMGKCIRIQLVCSLVSSILPLRLLISTGPTSPSPNPYSRSILWPSQGIRWASARWAV